MSLVTEIPRNVVFFSSRPVQKHLKLLIGIVLYRRIECKPVTLGNSGKLLAEMAGGKGSWQDGTCFTGSLSDAKVKDWLKSLKLSN